MSDLERKVLEQIETRGLKPRPLGWFMARRSMFWTLAGLAIFLGAVSVALGIFVLVDLYTSGGRGFDEMPFDELAGSLPAAWLASFVLFMTSASLAFANTKRGYRYPPRQVAALATAASLALGLALYGLDAGRITHRCFSAQFPGYRDYTNIPYDDWRRPDAGFLGGEVLSVESGRSMRLRDFDGGIWTVDIAGADIKVSDPLAEEGDVAIEGTRTGPNTFKARRVLSFD